MSSEDSFNLVSKLTPEQQVIERFRLRSISPDDGKYGESVDVLRPYLTPEAEWKACVQMQKVLLETRRDFGKAGDKHVAELEGIIEKIDPLNIALLEKDKRINHDQIAVITEMGRHASAETVALLHPGTTSYDLLDTARAYLFRKAWSEIMRPKIAEVVEQFCSSAEQSLNTLMVGRTHLQYTTPITLGQYFSIFGRRIAERVDALDIAFDTLKGKVSGIVGTGAGIEMVVGKGNAWDFERAALSKFGLEPDYGATQIVQKETLSDVGHGLVTLAYALGSFAEDIRKLYSSDIQEVTSRDRAALLGGSSAAAGKNNPIDWENIAGSVPIVEGGMRVLYSLLQSDFQRDLRGSKGARYQPQGMMAEVYEMYARASRALPQLSFNQDKLAEHLKKYADFPDEAMVAILRGEGWMHPQYGEGHTFVKHMARKAKSEGRPLLTLALEDTHFRETYSALPKDKQVILQGALENYLGDAQRRALKNIDFCRAVVA